MRGGSFFFSLCACTLTTLGFLAASDALHHWFVLPVTLCGILIGADFLDWLCNFDPFDPGGILAALGCHFFYLAPLLHVARDHWMSEATPPPDWRDWLGYMALLNAVGLLTYFLVRQSVISNPRPKATGGGWHVNRPLFYTLTIIALVVSAGLQVSVYRTYGGIQGFAETVINRSDPQRMAGMGWLFMVSECFPIVAMIAYAVYARGRQEACTWPVLFGVLLAFFALKMLFGGLRSNRMHTVWGLFWAVGIIHLWLRQLPRSFFLTGGALLIVFMYFYGLYKGAGLQAVETFNDPAAQGELSARTGRSWDTVLLGDLGRSDVQALLLYRFMAPGSDCQYAWGRTYLGAPALFIPRSIWPDRPRDRTKEGTEALYGRGMDNLPPDWISSRIYGLAGETMLNFGPAAIPLAFALLGWVVGRIRRFMQSLAEGDARRLLSPYLVILGFSLLVLDSDILLFQLVKDCLVPFGVLWFSTTKVVTDDSMPASPVRHAGRNGVVLALEPVAGMEGKA
jgi:hypothetical protein